MCVCLYMCVCVHFVANFTQYTLIDDPLRSINYLIGYRHGECGETLVIGWYRFKINGVNGWIQTSCPRPGIKKPYICNTAAARWYNGEFSF